MFLQTKEWKSLCQFFTTMVKNCQWQYEYCVMSALLCKILIWNTWSYLFCKTGVKHASETEIMTTSISQPFSEQNVDCIFRFLGNKMVSFIKSSLQHLKRPIVLQRHLWYFLLSFRLLHAVLLNSSKFLLNNELNFAKNNIYI